MASNNLAEITVVLAHTRFPENVGMAARACANMGVGRISLVSPEMWSFPKALPLATPKGKPILEKLKIFSSLGEALAGHGLVIGSTARSGGWRQKMLSPRAAAGAVCEALSGGVSVALLFGPEDRGLENEEIMLCHDLVKIPTSAEACSLNLAQAVLILLYECFAASKELAGPAAASAEKRPAASSQIGHEDYERLMSSLKTALLHIDFLHGDNPDYFFMPLRRFFGRKGIKRHEYDALMGVCRQIMRLSSR